MFRLLKKHNIIIIVLLSSMVFCLTSPAQEQANQKKEAEKSSTPSEDILFTDLCFSPDGKLLAVANSTGTVELLELPDLKMTKAKILKGHTDVVSSISFSPDGRILASGSSDKAIKLWEVETGKELNTLVGHTDKVRTICFSPDSKLLASGADDSEVKLWEVKIGKQLRTFKGNAKPAGSLAFSQDAHLLVVGANLTQAKRGGVTITFIGEGGITSNDLINIWDLETGKELKTLREYIGHSISTIFTPDGKLIVSGVTRFGFFKGGLSL